jgi:hypothetical protein
VYSSWFAHASLSAGRQTVSSSLEQNPPVLAARRFFARAFSTESGARGQGYIEKKCVFPRADVVRRRRQSIQHDAGKRRPSSAASVALDIASEPLASYDIHMKHTVEPGEFEITPGNSSRDADLQKAILTVTK